MRTGFLPAKSRFAVRGLCGVLAVLTLAPAPVGAHRGHFTLSVVTVDSTSGEVRVTHRMAAHDVEPALANIAPRAQRSLDDPAAMAALIEYTAAAFELSDENGRLELRHAATDLRGDDIRLTYVGRTSSPAPSFLVDSNLFEEVYRAQVNQVNVRRARVTRTVTFRSGSEAQGVSFP